MTLALPPIGWLVIISWTVLMITAIATADAVQNPQTGRKASREAQTALETPGYQIIEASINEGVCVRVASATPQRQVPNRRLQAAISA